MSMRENRNTKVFVVEEQEIYRELYKLLLPARPQIELVQVIADETEPDLRREIARYNPDVLLISIKKINEQTVSKLEELRNFYPQLGIVLLLVYYSHRDIESLRKLALSGGGGMALFLKQSLDLVEQLCGIISSVGQGQIILDPILTGHLLDDKGKSPFLDQLTSRELEILSLLSKGFTNSAIADSLFIDLKTVEHHINSMYSKLKVETDFNKKHLRVSAARLYLRAVGELSPASAPETSLISSIR